MLIFQVPDHHIFFLGGEIPLLFTTMGCNSHLSLQGVTGRHGVLGRRGVVGRVCDAWSLMETPGRFIYGKHRKHPKMPLKYTS